MPKYNKTNSWLAFGDPNFNPNDPTMNAARIHSILAQHLDKNFVQRMLNPTSVQPYVFPTDSDYAGKVGTHLMSYSTDDGGAVVYPEIVYNKETKRLERLNSDEAYKYAIKTGEHIRFDTPEEAEWFTTRYKTIGGFGE